MKAKRYEPIFDVMQEYPKGDWVKETDFQNLEKELDEAYDIILWDMTENLTKESWIKKLKWFEKQRDGRK